MEPPTATQIKKIINTFPPFRISEKGLGGWKRREGDHPPFKYNFISHAGSVFVSKKTRKKKSYTLVIIRELVFFGFLRFFFG